MCSIGVYVSLQGSALAEGPSWHPAAVQPAVRRSQQQHSLLLSSNTHFCCRGILAGLCTPAQPAVESPRAVHVVCSRPEQPFLVQPGPDHVLMIYPIWLPTGASRAYTACFLQVGWQCNCLICHPLSC